MSIVGLLLVSMFAMTAFAPLSNAYTHEGMTITILAQNVDVSTATKANPLPLHAGETVTIDATIVNEGSIVTLYSVTVTLKLVTNFIVFDIEREIWSDTFDEHAGEIPAGATHSESWSVVLTADMTGKYAIEILFDFAPITDYTVKFYVEIV